MLKSKGLIAGAAIAAVAGVLLVAGFTVSSTQGAGTDVPTVNLTPTTGTPPQSPPEVPVAPPAVVPTDPGINPEGNVGNNNGGPGGTSALPNAGYGTTANGGASTMLVLIAGAGMALVLAGGAVVAAGRRD